MCKGPKKAPDILYVISSSQRRKRCSGRKPGARVTNTEVTNRALGKLKVVHGRRAVAKGGHLTDLKNMADYQNLENIFHANISRH